MALQRSSKGQQLPWLGVLHQKKMVKLGELGESKDRWWWQSAEWPKSNDRDRDRQMGRIEVEPNMAEHGECIVLA